MIRFGGYMQALLIFYFSWVLELIKTYGIFFNYYFNELIFLLLKKHKIVYINT